MNTMIGMIKKVNAAWASAANFVAGVAYTFAATTSNITLNDPLNGASFATVTTNVISFLVTTVAIPLCAIMVLVGAFQIDHLGRGPG